jgi:hypothetical protein
MKGDVFSNDLIGVCVAYMHANEASHVRLWPVAAVFRRSVVDCDRRLRL